MSYGIQQPAISGQLRQLEKALGTRLFHRRPFALTSAGEKLFASIEPFFASLNELPTRIRGEAVRRLRLAAPATVLREYLPQVLGKYKRCYPDLQLTLYESNQAIAEELVRKHEVDLAITELEGAPSVSMNSCVLLRLPLVLVVPARSPLHASTKLLRNRLALPSLISLRPDEIISKHFQAELRKLGVSWTPSIEVSSLELVDLYTSLGFGVGVSLAVPRVKRRGGLRTLLLRKFQPLTVAALWCGDLIEPAKTFLQDIKTLASRLGR